jgi:hypothetical protein
MTLAPSSFPTSQPPSQSHHQISLMVLMIHKCGINEEVCHILALPFTLKKYLKAKEEVWKLKYFTMQKYNLQKIL